MEFKKKVKPFEYIPFKKKGHVCTVKDELIDPISIVIQENLICSGVRRRMARFRTITESNAIAQKLYRSQFAIDKEKIKHLLYYPFMIHPASTFRAWWERLMLVVLCINLTYTPVYMALLQIHKEDAIYHDKRRLITEAFCLLDILLNFITGTQTRQEYEATLDFRTVAIKYLKGTFFLDLIAWIPFDLLIFSSTEVSVYFDIFFLLKMLRILTLLRYIDRFGEFTEMRLMATRIIKMITFFFIYVTWVTFLQFSVVYLAEGSHTPTNPNPLSWMSFFGIWNMSKTEKFFIALFRATILVTQQGLGKEYPITSYDQFFAGTVWITAIFVNSYMMAMVISMVLGVNSSKSQYYMTTQQLKAYTDRKELPHYLRNKLLLFYQLRYHKYFFSETDILEAVSGRLLQDVMMHSCRKVVEDVPFLKHLPDDMLVRIVASLRSEIFLPSEVIVKVDSIGDCMYFIVTGTVAVYSAGGHELCHLQDGAHFGEVAVVGGPRRRTASVVALRPCELLRLDAAEFAKAVARHPELLEGILRLAADRMEHTYEVDKAM